jgi:hypothetical protein
MKYLPKNQLERLSSHRLISYKRKLNKLYYFTNGSDRWDGADRTEQDIELEKAWGELKKVLNARGDIKT